MDYSKLETGDISFSGWTVHIDCGYGKVSDSDGITVAKFEVSEDGHIALTEGEHKFADLALIALRSFVRYGCPQTV